MHRTIQSTLPVASWLACLWAMTGTVHGSSPQTAQQPNLLVIFADQLRSMELGCYGGDQIPTPNIDRLAREGVRFTNAISTYPLCSPFRAMLMTGNYPLKNGMVMNDHFLRNPTPCFAEACKAAGYRTAYIGKWHLDGHGRTARIPRERWRGFEIWRTLECTHRYFQSDYYFQDEAKPRRWPQYDAVSQTDEACRLIGDMLGEKPFCLFLSWGPPHDPYVAPDEYMDRFDPARVRLRENVDDFTAAERLWNECDTRLPEEFRKSRQRLLAGLRDPANAEIRNWYRGYYAAITLLDDCMGRILATLERRGELDSTVIVFTSDHGDNLGSHRQYGKDLPYEESISIPFLVRYPPKIAPGVVTDALLAPVDMMPTTLSLADVPCPDVDGKDISAAARGSDENKQVALLLMRPYWLGTNWITNGTGPWRGVRTKRYTYARRSDNLKPWMLFDNQQDPFQMHNLVTDPDHAALVKELDAKTDELLKLAKDPENPLFFANLIQEERNARGQPDRRHCFFPAFVEPGTDFEESAYRMEKTQ
ncbi:MAG: sulfatase [Planctomycetota bacterium]